jgi:glycerophosphoryl diester phosphodiesterase
MRARGRLRYERGAMSAIGLLTVLVTATPIEVQGHRGARAVRPENTLAAFAYALGVGVDTLELDLAVTKDDVVVVSHDPHLTPERCLGPKGVALATPVAIRDLTVAQVKTYDCGSLKNPRFPKQVLAPAKIPTLDEVFAHVKASKHRAAKRVHFNLETKIFPAHPELTPTPKKFAELVVASVRRHDMVARTIVQSFDYRTLEAVKAKAPKIRIAMLQPDGLVPLVPVAKALRAEIVSPHHEWILKADVEALHAAGVRVVPWTANDEAAWARLLDLGVDGIITDDPAALIAYLEKRGRR